MKDTGFPIKACGNDGFKQSGHVGWAMVYQPNTMYQARRFNVIHMKQKMNLSFSTLSIPALNHLLAQEPWASQQLQLHAGKVICIDLTVFKLRAKISTQGYLKAVPDDMAANVVIKINPADVPYIFQDHQHAAAYVKLEGDADLAQTISGLGKNLRWDIEQQLSELLGDIAARRIANTGKAMVTILQSNAKKIKENLAEYFLEENPLLVRSSSTSEFAQQVARLRDDVERIGKRVEKCEKT